MQKIMEMLSKIKIEDLRANLYPTDFINQLKEDFRKILPTKSDSDKQKENLLAALFKVAKDHPDLFGSETLEKLKLIYQLAAERSEDQLLLVDLNGGVEHIIKNEMEDTKIHIVTQIMENIMTGLKENQPAIVMEYLLKLKEFKQQNYPRQPSEQFSAEFKSMYEETKLPSMKSLGILSREMVIDENDPQYDELHAMHGELQNAIELFKSILGTHRVQHAVSNEHINENEINAVMEGMRKILPGTIELNNKAENAIDSLGTTCISCLQALAVKINDEVKSSPELYSFYKDKDSNDVAIDKLLTDLVFRENHFVEDKNITSLQTNLKVDMLGYIENEYLLTLLAPSPNAETLQYLDAYQTGKKKEIKNFEKNEAVNDPVKRLENFRDRYESKQTQNICNSNSDPRIVRFFKAYAYYLANFFTLGMVHLIAKAITKGSPLHSPQQKAGKEHADIIKAAEKSNVIKKPGKN